MPDTAQNTDLRDDRNVILAAENYIAGVSDVFGAKLHRHPVIEIYASSDGDSHIILENGEARGQIIVIGVNTVHAISDTGKTGIALFVDPLSEFGYSLSSHILQGRSYASVSADISLSLLSREMTDTEIRQACEEILQVLQGDPVPCPFHETVRKTIALVSDEDCTYRMEDIAKQVYLSKSRLAHVFSEETGITLKEYLQYKRLERACRKILTGTSITDAAYETGYAGSSHIAVSSIRLTGMALRKMLGL